MGAQAETDGDQRTKNLVAPLFEPIIRDHWLRKENIPTVALMRDVKAWESMDWCRELPEVEALRGSLLHPADWQQSPKLRGVTAIIHTAAEVKHSRKNVSEMLELNVGGTLEMVRAAGRLGARLIFVSR